MGLTKSITYLTAYANTGVRNIVRRVYSKGYEDPIVLGEHPFLVSSCTTKLTFSASTSSVSPGEVIHNKPSDPSLPPFSVFAYSSNAYTFGIVSVPSIYPRGLLVVAIERKEAFINQ